MANKALGRDLGHLLSRARPARLVSDVAPRPAPAESPPNPAPTTPPPQPQDLPLDLPQAAETPAATAPQNVGVFAANPKPSTYRRTRSAYPPPPAVPQGLDSTADSGTAFYTLLVLDSVLLGATAILLFTDWVPAPLSRYAAMATVLAGGLCTALAYILRPVPPPKPEASKVRVHLRRI